MNLILHPCRRRLIYGRFSRYQRHRLITDYGSQQAIPTHTIRRFNSLPIIPTDFLLSHFHLDHYKGIFLLENYHLRTRFRNVYCARLPEMPEATHLMFAMLSISAFSLGSRSGSLEYDFIRTISRVNLLDFAWHRLSQGDHFSVGERKFTVTWPPRVLPDDTKESIMRTISDFEKTIDAYPQIKKLYEQMRERGELWVRGIGEGRTAADREDSVLKVSPDTHEDLQHELPIIAETREWAQALKPLNTKLKRAANQLSLAYFDEQLNFFGDLYPPEISRCVEYIESVTAQREWSQVVLPHHGTQWHDALLKLQGVLGCSSIGPELWPYWKNENESFCHLNLKTYPIDRPIVLG